ncbi:hypothetical protein J2S10_003692 [Neobacillus ginsengisoli]|uniref:Molybdopterin dehydrogenase FAD-binding domain-containing protein n=1 Tax=Neobacillus ginsengisoli TaxID=904295 RepID=A0ABT9XYQ6_9BACI|nr:hypothetical protein [Neobacillus ginsengisoli]
MIRKESATQFSPTVWMPEKLAEAWRLKEKFGTDACYIAGGTLLQTQWEKGLDCPDHLISLERIKEMQGCSIETDGSHPVIRLGVLTTIDKCRYPSVLLEGYPLLMEAARNIAAPAIRNKGKFRMVMIGHPDYVSFHGIPDIPKVIPEAVHGSVGMNQQDQFSQTPCLEKADPAAAIPFDESNRLHRIKAHTHLTPFDQLIKGVGRFGHLHSSSLLLIDF